jgi:hypothetical protein
MVSSAEGGPFILPIGDIAPKTGPDGKINTADRSELTVQWRVLGTQNTARTGDFNKDTKVNSVDWACMRYDFNKEDEVINEQALIEEMDKDDPDDFVPSRIYSIPGSLPSGGSSNNTTSGTGKAILSLDPATRTSHTSCNIQAKIIVDTGGRKTDGADVILNFNPDDLEATSITQGSIYERYPNENMDNSAGKVTISGIAPIGVPYSGKGTFATVNFKVKGGTDSKNTEVKFDFDPNNKSKTTDSNVVENTTIKDLLDSVSNGSYFVDKSQCN